MIDIKLLDAWYTHELDHIIRHRDIGLWLVKHKHEFKDVEDGKLTAAVAKASGYSPHDLVTTAAMIRAYAKSKKES